MKWYSNLYVGDKAKENEDKIITAINKGKVQFNKYVLALPFNNSDVLDIYPSNIIIQKHYHKSDMMVVGIAEGEQEAKDVMQKLIMDCYEATGGFNLRGYIESGC